MMMTAPTDRIGTVHAIGLPLASDDDAYCVALPPREVQALADLGMTRSYPRHTILITEGDRSNALYVILNGKVKIFTSEADGREVTLNIQGPGEFFGELALIDAAPVSGAAMTLKHSRLLVVSREKFERCMRTRPSLAMHVARALAARIQRLTETVRNFALLDVYGRVARTLDHLAKPHHGRYVIAPRPTHQDIAQRVGASREMVIRIMQDLERGHYIAVHDHDIEIVGRLPRAW